MLLYMTMETKNVFITGATGCIGHYVVQELLKVPHYHLHLFVRDPKRLKLDLPEDAPITFVLGDMTKVEELGDRLKEMDYLVHIATPWGNCEGTIETNVKKSLALFELLDMDRCERIVYFSTASILNEDNGLNPIAKTDGTPYIRSKYMMYEEVQKLPYRDKIFTVFPTAVFGGNHSIPKSHLYEGIPQSTHYLKWLRWFSVDASCHFLHAADIAVMVKGILEYRGKQRDFVLGRPVLHYKELLKALCKAYSVPIYLSIPIPVPAVYRLLSWFKIELKPWDHHCIQRRHFQHRVTSPADLGLDVKFHTIDDVLKDLKKLS